jgi:hypothetical protein
MHSPGDRGVSPDTHSNQRLRFLEKYLDRAKAISDAAIIKFENAVATDFANRLQTGDDESVAV